MAENVASTKPPHADNADSLVPPNTTQQTPGRLTGGARMELHTRDAHRLFYGRRATEIDGNSLKPIVGLVRFAYVMGGVWKAAMADDPYADWTLLEVEHALEKTNALLETHIANIQNLIEGVGGIEFDIQESTKPVQLPMSFYTPYGFMAGRLLVAYDDMVRLALTARHVGLLFEDDWASIVWACGKAIRRTFLVPYRWQHTGVTRDDLVANNAVARRCLDVYATQTERQAEIPADVLAGERRAKVRPPIKRPSNLEQSDVSDLEPSVEDAVDEDVAKEINAVVTVTREENAPIDSHQGETESLAAASKENAAVLSEIVEDDGGETG